ncbi:MAG: di-heme oxidoredictase family protein [Pseudomonadota bacterium]
MDDVRKIAVIGALFGATVCAFSTVAISANWGSAAQDPHLNTVPRTDSERQRIAAVLKPTSLFEAAEKFESNAGGAATSTKFANKNAFSQSSANLPFEEELTFKVGNGLFKKLWVTAPSSNVASDGLGPLYNARSCQRCHLKDGRGHPPEGPQDNRVSMLMRLSVPSDDAGLAAQIEGYLATAPEPTYGGQLQDFSIAGHKAEGRIGISYEEIEVPLSGGETAHLRKPRYSIDNPGFGPMHADVMLSPRIAPPMIGLGLLEAIPSTDLLALADPDDADGDGISGRPNIVWSVEHNQPMLGRFGWKAGQPTMIQQSASAFAGDIGISTPLFPAGWGDCTAAQMACQGAPHGDAIAGIEVDEEVLDLVTFYSRNLAVPVRRDVSDPEVLRGKEVFYATDCTSCHTPKHVTHRLTDRPEHSFQLIWPYSDLLLHDMGEGLADNRPEARATGREWRTPPLWGIGLTETVNGHTYFLHDGRARNLLEAILWHGGEAQTQRDRLIEMPPEDRAALIRFLESL